MIAAADPEAGYSLVELIIVMAITFLPIIGAYFLTRDTQDVAGLTEDSADHDLVDGIEGLAEVVADIDTLAGGESVGLEYKSQGAAEDEVAGLGGGIEDAFLATFLDLNLGVITSDYYSPIEISGLYWHFVDIVWIFLFPLLYLLGRHAH